VIAIAPTVELLVNVVVKVPKFEPEVGEAYVRVWPAETPITQFPEIKENELR
jgi:hypothetical protein